MRKIWYLVCVILFWFGSSLSAYAYSDIPYEKGDYVYDKYRCLGNVLFE